MSQSFRFPGLPWPLKIIIFLAAAAGSYWVILTYESGLMMAKIASAIGHNAAIAAQREQDAARPVDPGVMKFEVIAPDKAPPAH